MPEIELITFTNKGSTFYMLGDPLNPKDNKYYKISPVTEDDFTNMYFDPDTKQKTNDEEILEILKQHRIYKFKKSNVKKSKKSVKKSNAKKANTKKANAKKSKKSY